LGAIIEAHFDQTFNASIKGLLFTVQKALSPLVDGASIILNAFTAASTATPAFSVYTTTNAGVRSFARSWTLDLKYRHIHANAHSLGATESAGWHGLTQIEEQARGVNALVNRIPLGGTAPSAEIAKAAVSLASDDSSYVTGIELFAHGRMAQI
jgi:NAD(P)-dependent dehydrogenase (short-subunit alcohol dehydrogenase family)